MNCRYKIIPKLNINIVKVGQFTRSVTPIAMNILYEKSKIGVRIVKKGPLP